jgi:hypothetical protein
MSHDLDSLLSRGRLSGAQRERVLDAVLDRVAPARRHWVPWMAAAAILCVLGGTTYLGAARSRQHEFTARGGTSATRVEVVCLGGSLDACPRGSHLAFRATGPKGAGYLTAYAVPESGGERIWYFSGDDESPIVTPSTTSAEPMDRVVVVGNEHGAGGFTVHILISERPLPRTDALDAAPGSVISTQTIHMRVVP